MKVKDRLKEKAWQMQQKTDAMHPMAKSMADQGVEKLGSRLVKIINWIIFLGLVAFVVWLIVR